MATPVILGTCGYCGKAAVAHSIVHAYDAYDGQFVAAFTRCPNCDHPGAAVLRQMGGNASHLLSATQGDVEKAGWRILHRWPKPTPPDIPQFLPPTVERYYWQAANVLATTPMPRDDEPTFADTAVIMCRRTLEAALQDIGDGSDERLPLAARIRRLADDGRITRDLADWADHIRQLGNDAVHGPEPLPPGPEGVAQAQIVLEFTRLVLMYLYTLPGMVEAARNTTRASGES